MTFGSLAPECPNVKKIKKVGLDQYRSEHFENLAIFMSYFLAFVFILTLNDFDV